VAVASENGCLLRVAVVSPKYYRPTEPINEKQVVEYQIGQIDHPELLEEHVALVAALRECGVDVVEVEPNPLQPYALNVRDSAVMIGHQLFAGSMGKDVRRSEPFWIIPQIGHATDAVFLNSGHLEGGDVFLLADAVLVGLSERTDKAGAAALAEATDRRVIPVPLRPGVLHLDTALNLVGQELMVAPDLVEDFGALRRQVAGLGVVSILEITSAEAWELETNFLFVGPAAAVCSAASSKGRVILEDRGIAVVPVPMTQHHRIGGSVRCATLPLDRTS
jgi:N-dimethylarginine dimethylaminohydrolase